MGGGRAMWILGGALMVLPLPAAADSLDGNWCRKGLSLSIDGPAIVTPGGTRMTGDYGRHDFSYVTPAGETRAGRRVNMVQLDDETMHLGFGGAGAPVEVWTRCKPPIS